jgi:hypothetical protein
MCIKKESVMKKIISCILIVFIVLFTSCQGVEEIPSNMNPINAIVYYNVDTPFFVHFKKNKFKKDSIINFDFYYGQSIINSEGFPNFDYISAFFNYKDYMVYIQNNFPSKTRDDGDYFDKVNEFFGVNVIEDILIDVRVEKECNNPSENLTYLIKDLSIYNKNTSIKTTSLQSESIFNCPPINLFLDTNYWSDDTHYIIFVDTTYILKEEYIKSIYMTEDRAHDYKFPWGQYFYENPEETSVVLTKGFEGHFYIGESNITSKINYWYSTAPYLKETK